MFTKRTINTLIAGSLLVTPALFMAVEPSNQVTGWDRIRDFSAGVALIGGAKIADATADLYLTHNDDVGIYFALKLMSACTAMYSALFAAKAFSNATWTDVLRNNKTATIKYIFYGTIAAGLGINLSTIIQKTGGRNSLYPPFSPMEFGAAGLTLGFAGIAAALAGENLQAALTVPIAA